MEVEAHHVHACVLIGALPTEQSRLRSFELFRHNLKDVVVVTFDELLRKVADLCSFLEGKSEALETPDEQGEFEMQGRSKALETPDEQGKFDAPF